MLSGYVQELTAFLCNDVLPQPEDYQRAWLAVGVPAPLNASYKKPDKAEAVLAHVSRFSKSSVVEN